MDALVLEYWRAEVELRIVFNTAIPSRTLVVISHLVNFQDQKCHNTDSPLWGAVLVTFLVAATKYLTPK